MEGFSLTLATKNTFDGWIDFEDGSRLKIDYPTLPQKAKLNSFLLKMSGTEKENRSVVSQDYMRWYIKFTVKEWDLKMKDAPKCQTVKDDNNGTELRDDLWFMLCDSIPQTAVIFNKITNELEADETTKKK